MTLQFEAEALGDFVLTLFNLAIDEFLNGTALQADQMIMVVAIIQLKSGIVCVKMVTNQNSRRFELRQHAVNSCKADRKSTRLNSSHPTTSRMPSSA